MDWSTSIAEDYNLELQYRKPFTEVWSEEKDSPVFGPLSERMGVRGRDAGPLLVSKEEMEAAGMQLGHCRRASCTKHGNRLLSCVLLLQSLKAAGSCSLVVTPPNRAGCMTIPPNYKGSSCCNQTSHPPNSISDTWI